MIYIRHYIIYICIARKQEGLRATCGTDTVIQVALNAMGKVREPGYMLQSLFIGTPLGMWQSLLVSHTCDILVRRYHNATGVWMCFYVLWIVPGAYQWLC